MTGSLIPARPPSTTDLVQTKNMLVQLREYLESPAGAARAPGDTRALGAAIDLLHKVIENYNRATLIP
jgi:hypothetical protein